MPTIDFLKLAVRSIELDQADEAKTIINDLIRGISAQGGEYRVKVGLNPYANEWECSIDGCGKKFVEGGLFLLIERVNDGKSIDIHICDEHLKTGNLFENVFKFGEKGVLKLA
jgi:hypothetical protein